MFNPCTPRCVGVPCLGARQRPAPYGEPSPRATFNVPRSAFHLPPATFAPSHLSPSRLSPLAFPPLTSHLSPSRLSPLASRLSPLASRLSPLASRLSPLAFPPLASHLSPLASHLSPLAFPPLARRNQVTIPFVRGHPYGADVSRPSASRASGARYPSGAMSRYSRYRWIARRSSPRCS